MPVPKSSNCRFGFCRPHGVTRKLPLARTGAKPRFTAPECPGQHLRRTESPNGEPHPAASVAGAAEGPPKSFAPPRGLRPVRSFRVPAININSEGRVPPQL